MDFNYAILGAGKQGTAAAYDVAVHGMASRLLLADADERVAKASVARLGKLLGKRLRESKIKLVAAKLDASKRSEIEKALKGCNAVLSALPYYLNPAVAEAAIKTGTHYGDLGGDLDAARAVAKLDAKAKKAGVVLVSDLGLAPGMCNSLAAAAMEMLSITRDIHIYCGGLPQKPRPPLGYKLVFNLEGLLASYFGKAYALRKGAVSLLDPFSELEELDFGEPLGRLEAFATAGGAALCPWSYQGRLQTYLYKTLRYPGHHAKIQLLRDLGMLDEKPVPVDGVAVAPRRLFLAAAGPRLSFPDERDLVVLRVVARGQKEGKNTELSYDVLDYYDPKTGFTAMERTTGFSAAVALEMLAHGLVRERGAVPLEKAVSGRAFLDEVRKRGIRVTETIRVLDSAN